MKKCKQQHYLSKCAAREKNNTWKSESSLRDVLVALLILPIRCFRDNILSSILNEDDVVYDASWFKSAAPRLWSRRKLRMLLEATIVRHVVLLFPS